MESIVQIRQMMADEKFQEAQKLIELQLVVETTARYELLTLYSEALRNQQMTLPSHLILELASFESEKKNHERTKNYLNELKNEDRKNHFVKIAKIEMKMSEDCGLINNLYQQLSLFLITLYEKRLPLQDSWLDQVMNKYFKNDFQLGLKKLALLIFVGDLKKSESLIQELILEGVETAFSKQQGRKLHLLANVLETLPAKSHLEIYKWFCLFEIQGMKNSSEYKRLIEMVIYFDDFKMQVLVLNLLEKLELKKIAQDYAQIVRSNKSYDFVYLDKYFSSLKSYFVKVEPKRIQSETSPLLAADLKLEGISKTEMLSQTIEETKTEEPDHYYGLLKHENYTTEQLCDLCVGFLQGEMPKVALYAANEAIKRSANDVSYLKACYLKLSALLILNDYRPALDTCFDALGRASTKDDVLSFLYGQAEIYIRMKEMSNAKRTLQKIVSIDSEYRFAKERLEKLNEI